MLQVMELLWRLSPRHPSKGSRTRRDHVHYFVSVRDGGVCDVLLAELQRVGQLLAVGCVHLAHVCLVVLWRRAQMSTVR